MTPTPADMPRRPPGQRNAAEGFDPEAHYPYGSLQFWKKRAHKRQHIINGQQFAIDALEERLHELEAENIALRKELSK